MNFYISFLLLCLAMCVFSKNIVTKSGLNQPVPCSIGLKFFTEINNTSGEDCTVEVHPDECCLDSNDNKCNIIEVIGSAAAVIPEGTSKTLELVAPLLEPYNRRGFCTIYVDFKPNSKPKNFIRDTIKIKFDTTINKYNLPDDAVMCKHVDEDPMNECKPVNCETYYNGRKSFFNLIKRRCIDVPTCQAKTNSEIPKTAYNPVSNKCFNKPSINKDDINFIKALTGGKSRKAKDILIIKMNNRNHSQISEETLNDFEYTTMSRVAGMSGVRLSKVDETTTTTTSKPQLKLVNNTKLPLRDERIHLIMKYISANKYTILALTGIITLQCCLICCMIYCLSGSCGCGKKKKVINKFFNYRQDASVTTPLICTSNIDTETTDYQYLSESSNYIDKKIKCYKACQKERKNNIKLSMSDDILSKCLTRRDWHRLPRSETIPEVRNDEEKTNDFKEKVAEIKKPQEIKVNFQDEYQKDKKVKAVKSIFKKVDTKKNIDIDCDSSEKVIRSYNYDANNNNSNVTGFNNNSSHCKNFAVYKQENHQADSIEQGAQAYFSNDSIDDFLSERGVLFIGDRASKYSFTSISSAGKSTCSTQSSKTSKNNVVKNVMSLLSKKSKGPSSDPGIKKSNNPDVELLHISRASVCSSSNDTDMGKDLRRIKDSTSSL